MRLRIARKICFRLGYGYPINNIGRIEKAVTIYERAVRRSYKEFMRKARKDGFSKWCSHRIYDRMAQEILKDEMRFVR